MENMIYILFICMFAPLLLGLPLIKKSSRGVMIFILIGIGTALFISEVNGLFLNLLKNDTAFVTTTITPVTEEIVKNWIIGRTRIPIDKACAICDLFGWPMDRLAVRGEWNDQSLAVTT